MGKTLENLINTEVKTNVGRYNFLKGEVKQRKLNHHDVCKQIVAFSEESGFPIGVIVYIAVGTDAHKPSVFSEGYKKFDEAKAKRIVKMCKIFAEHFGISEAASHSDKLVHALCRYDNLFADSGKIGFLRSCINDIPKPQKGVKFKMAQFATAKDVARFIFGTNLKYNERGYIIAE